MMTGLHCACLVCRLETSLVAELSEERVPDERVVSSDSGELLSSFSSPLDLVRKLHASEDHKNGSSTDPLLQEILKQHSASPLASVWQRLLLLVFIPTIHRTTSQITAMFPSLARDDTAQHVLAVFLEFLHSSELQTRHTHLAFTISRKLRRQAFRWAIRESRGRTPEEADGASNTDADEVAGEEPLHAEVHLDRFLDHCQKLGWLSLEERELLVRSKIEGVTCQELAARNGHGAIAVQHRIQRLVDRLRRLARGSEWRRAPEQLELFAR